jgi:hypothetical protein
MDYYSNELEDDFIEIDDTISNEEYHFSEVKEKKKEDKTPYYDWCKYAVISGQPAILYADPWRPINQIDAQQCNAYRQDLRTLANACQTQQVITNPTDFIQQQLNTSCNNLENGLRNLCDTISKIIED